MLTTAISHGYTTSPPFALRHWSPHRWNGYILLNIKIISVNRPVNFIGPHTVPWQSTLHPQKFSNTWRWNCGSRNSSRTWNAGCTQSTRCTNLTFTPFDTSNVMLFFCKIGMRKCARKYFRWYCLLEGLINLNKGQNFHNIGSPLKFSIDVSSGSFVYQMIAQETNLRKNVEWRLYRPMWLQRWRHIRPWQNRYTR